MIPEKTLLPTPGQTVGPFFAYGVEYPKMHEVVHPHSPGAIVLEGTVYDGAGQPIPDALIEIWGADEDGSISRARGAFRRDDHTFTGFGRAATNDDGHYEFWTRNPGAEPGKEPRERTCGLDRRIECAGAGVVSVVVFAPSREEVGKSHTLYMRSRFVIGDV